MRVNRKISIALLAVAAATLAACGGGGSSGPTNPDGTLKIVTATSPDTASVNGGQDVIVDGNGVTARNAMTTMAWQVQALTAGAPALVTTNSDCSTAVKNSQQGTNNGGTAYTASTWQCSVDVKAPILTADAQYKLILTATDSAGTTDTHVTTLTVKASATTSAPLTVDAGSAQTLVAGSGLQLNCLAAGGQIAAGSNYNYQWVQTSGANAAITLSDAHVAAPTFNAPAVSVATPVTLQCRVTDDAGTTKTADKSLIINPATGNVVIASAGASSVVAPGQNVTLDGSKSGWFNAAGTASTGSALYYRWTQTGGSALAITNGTSPSGTITIPNDVSASTVYSFHLDVADAPFGTAAAHASSADVNVTADPAGQMALTLPLPSQSVSSNTAVLLQAKVTTTSPVYYSWTQISGPTVAIGGALTGTAGIVAPTVSSPTTLVFRVTAGYKPITGGYAGVVSQDAVVVVTP